MFYYSFNKGLIVHNGISNCIHIFHIHHLTIRLFCVKSLSLFLMHMFEKMLFLKKSHLQ